MCSHLGPQHSMSESEVKPFRTFVRGGTDIIHLLLSGHLAPSFLSGLVPADVVVLDCREQDDVEAADSQQYLVASDVVRPVALTIYVCTNDVASLHCDRVRPAMLELEVCTRDIPDMLYKAADTARVRTELELREFQATRTA